MLVHTRKGRHADMLVRRIYHVLIHLVRHNESIIFDCQLPDLGQLFSGKYLSAGVGRVADDDRFRALLKALFYQIDVKLIRRRHQRNIDRLCPGQNRVCPIIFIKWGKYHNLISRIADGHHGTHHGFCTAAGHDNLRLRIDLSSNRFSLLLRQRFAEILRSEGNGILVRSLISHLC